MSTRDAAYKTLLLLESVNHKQEEYVTEFPVLLGKPSVITWQHGRAFSDEGSIAVWFDYNHDLHPCAKREEFLGTRPLAKRSTFPRFLGAAVWNTFDTRRDMDHLRWSVFQGYLPEYISNTALRYLKPFGDPEE